MRLGVLETGLPPETLRPRFGGYPAMFQDLLGEDFAWRTYDVQAGEWPDRPEAEDGYLVTGSAAGVYEDDAWIARLLGFLRAAKGRARLVGVCFGHQAMAEALGGKVVKSPKGWGVGLHTYEVAVHEPWMDAGATISVPASHQDQVVELPPGARVLAGSTFTPYGMLDYGDGAVSLQLHPEFDPAYAQALIQSRREERISSAAADAAIRSLHAPNDNRRVGAWLKRFLLG